MRELKTPSGCKYGTRFEGGKFLPFHRGHLDCILRCASECKKLFVVLTHKDDERGGRDAKARALSPVQLVGACALVAIATIGYHFVLEGLGGAVTMLDGASTVLSVFATLLMALRYSEQWFFWIIVDVITVALWCVAGDPVMIAMWAAYLVNAVYGYLMWLNKSGRDVLFKRFLDAAAR